MKKDQKKELSDYTVPLKVTSMVDKHIDEETKQKVRMYERGSPCPLYGTSTYKHYVHTLIGTMEFPKATEGCMAIRDPVCYAEGPSRSYRGIDSPAECPVLRRIKEHLG
jgi:hypothetical protein